jgi:hypothetical protein
MAFKSYKIYKSVEVSKEELGYKTLWGNMSQKAFKRANWQGMLIDSDISYTDGAHNMVPFDLDNDSKMEMIANSYRSDALILYKCDGQIDRPENWSRYVIDPSVGGGIPWQNLFQFAKSFIKEKLFGAFRGGAHFIEIADMNNDGRNDIVIAGDKKRNDIIWYEVPDDIKKSSSYKKHVVYRNNSHRTYHIGTNDIDGDGMRDIVFAAKTDNSIGWLKNNGSLNEWPLTWIDTDCVRCFNARIADMDKNGKSDIIASEDDLIAGGKLHIFSFKENPLLKKNWIDCAVAEFPKGHGVSIFEIIDIDIDGDLDVVTGNHQGDVYIIENNFPHNMNEEWNKYKINDFNINMGHDFREIDVGDIDGDRDLDIIVADEGKNMIIWFENPGNPYDEGWTSHVLDKSDQYLNWCHFVELKDIDGDEDLDAAVTAAGSNTFLIYLNNITANVKKDF